MILMLQWFDDDIGILLTILYCFTVMAGTKQKPTERRRILFDVLRLCERFFIDKQETVTVNPKTSIHP